MSILYSERVKRRADQPEVWREAVRVRPREVAAEVIIATSSSKKPLNIIIP